MGKLLIIKTGVSDKSIIRKCGACSFIPNVPIILFVKLHDKIHMAEL